MKIEPGEQAAIHEKTTCLCSFRWQHELHIRDFVFLILLGKYGYLTNDVIKEFNPALDIVHSDGTRSGCELNRTLLF